MAVANGNDVVKCDGESLTRPRRSRAKALETAMGAEERRRLGRRRGALRTVRTVFGACVRSWCYILSMPGAGFAVTKGARCATRIGGRLRAVEKAFANRRNRRQGQREVRGADADVVAKLYTDFDVI